MLGPSRAAMHAAREALAAQLAATRDRTAVGEDLLAVARLLSSNVVLRRAVADPSRQGSDKVALVRRLLEGKIGEPPRQVVETVVSSRWASDGDLVDAIEALGVESVLAEAEAHDRLDRVEDELFRFNRIVAGNPELRAALMERRVEPSAREELVRRLLAGKAAPETERLALLAVGTPRAGRYDRAIEGFLEVAARRQEQLTAVVTAAVPLTEDQHERLVRALRAHYGRPIHANVIVDPGVVGGIRIEIGDEVIDGTVVSRLEEARRRMVG
jgi:F-type H+-transporting ATPase subunit delta